MRLLILLAAASAACGARAADAPSPAVPVATESVAALVGAFERRLVASTSATQTLESWCAEHRLAQPARIAAERAAGTERPADASTRGLLAVDADTPLRYRKVLLRCGDHVLSEAENWYVPGRLTAAMNAALDGSDTPFGTVIRPLGPTRRTLATTGMAPGTQAVGAPCDGARTALTHRALVLDGTGRPLALVVEHYRLELACAAR